MRYTQKPEEAVVGGGAWPESVPVYRWGSRSPRSRKAWAGGVARGAGAGPPPWRNRDAPGTTCRRCCT